MNYSNIKNLNQRQFNATMKRECITVSDYYDRTKTYDVFFRRSRRGSNPQGKVRIYFSQDTPIDIGTMFVLKDDTYVVTSRDGDESDVFYTSMAVKCDTSFTVFSNAEHKYVSIPFVTLSDKFTLSSNSTISMISGSVVIYTGDNSYLREVELNHGFYNYGGYYKLGNTFYNNGLAYWYMTREAMPADKYTLSYNGVTSLDMKDATTYQLSYTAIKNDVPVDNPTLTYVSSNDTIATVDGNGLMTMLKQGSVKITATWTDGNNTTCETTIDITNSGVEPEPAVPSIEIYTASHSIYLEGNRKLTVKFYNGTTEVTDTAIADLTRNDFVWTCSIDGVDVTNNKNLITWSNNASDAVNIKRIGLAYDENYLGKYLDITCVVNGMTATKSLEITSF